MVVSRLAMKMRSLVILVSLADTELFAEVIAVL